MALQFTTSYLEDSIQIFQQYKRIADGALVQVADDKLSVALDEESNSIAILIKHMAGNMRSRWTDFLTADGEKPSRNRDSEFVEPPSSRAELMELWERGWNCLFHALEQLSEEDLNRAVTIRGEKHSVVQAINRQIAHNAYHCGQLVFLAKHLRRDEWKTLSVARGRSGEFNRMVRSGEASQR